MRLVPLPLLCTFVVAAAALAPAAVRAADALVAYRVADDAIPDPIADAGDAGRGRKIALDRSVGGCVLCHAFPEPTARFMGTLGPSLSGIGNRYTPGQLRLRIVDGTRVNADAAMPSYYRTTGLYEVASQYRDRAVLTAQQVEDVVAYLGTLQ